MLKKRSLLALATGGLFYLLVHGAYWYMAENNITLESNTYSKLLTLSLLLGSFLTGFVAEKKGWLYGLIINVLSYIATFAYIASIVVSSTLEAKSQNIPIKGDWGGMDNLALNLFIVVLIPAALIGALGGFLGQLLFEVKSKHGHR